MEKQDDLYDLVPANVPLPERPPPTPVRPVSTAPLAKTLTGKVVGVTFCDGYPDNLHRLRDLEAFRMSDPNTAAEPLSVVLRRNPDNPHDTNAVEVHVPALAAMIGHLPRSLAARMAPRIDAGEWWRAHVVQVNVMPGHEHQPGIVVRLFDASDEMERVRVERVAVELRKRFELTRGSFSDGLPGDESYGGVGG